MGVYEVCTNSEVWSHIVSLTVHQISEVNEILGSKTLNSSTEIYLPRSQFQKLIGVSLALGSVAEEIFFVQPNMRYLISFVL